MFLLPANLQTHHTSYYPFKVFMPCKSKARFVQTTYQLNFQSNPYETSKKGKNNSDE